ncbi:MAG: polysaccharide deacetylase family protein [Haloarculaceae archaeon]
MTDGRLALVFDDGYAEEYDDLYPVLGERGVPASLAVVPEWLGDDGHLTADELDELVDAGWEVVAHGRRHRYLQAHALAEDAGVGDERLHLDSDHVFPGEDHALYPGDTFEVTDGPTTELHTLAAKGDGEPVVTLDEPLSAEFAAAETVFRPTAAQVEDEVAGVRGEFEALGYDPTTFALPYDAGDPRVRRAVAGEYDALVNATPRSLPSLPGTPPLALSRYYLETTHMRMVEVETYLDEVAETGGLGVLAGHAAWESVPAERVAAVVDAAHARDVAVTTVRDAVQ